MTKNEDIANAIKNWSILIFQYGIFPIGIISNLFSIIIFSRKTFRETGMGVYLLSESILFEIALISQLLVQFKTFNFTPRSNATCKLLQMTFFVSIASITYLSTMVSIDRFFLIKYPQKFKIIKKLKFQLIVVLVTIILPILTYTYYIYCVVFVEEDNQCELTDTATANSFMISYTLIPAIFNILIPVIIMTITAIIIIVYVFRIKRKVHQQTGLQKKDYLFAISSIVPIIFFLICNIPFLIYNVFSTYLAIDISSSVLTVLSDADTYLFLYL